jgi:Na+/H+ antiporter NhaD/arsenite permease-like protein
MFQSSLSNLIILATYIGLALGYFPRLRMNRATIALTGAALLVLVGGISEHDAVAAIDVPTLLLLGAMMVVNVNLKLAGFFRFVTSHTLRLAKTPKMLLALVILSSGLLSAIFLNDPICLMLTPLVLDIARRLEREPIPYLFGLGVAANVGSVATITGNPQNIIIGQQSGIPYLSFMLYLAPVALIGLVICWIVIVLAYPKEFSGEFQLVKMPEPRPYRPLLLRTGSVVFVLMIALLAGAPIVTSACVAAAALLISRLRPAKLLALDWDLLAFFAGLFAVTGAIESTGLSAALFEGLRPYMQDNVLSFSLITAGLSNIVSNVPAVLLLQTEIDNFANPNLAWLTLAMASTLAGNLTLLGSAATLIVAELAKVRGVELGFVAYLRVGIPITILTMAVGIGWLMLVG